MRDIATSENIRAWLQTAALVTLAACAVFLCATIRNGRIRIETDRISGSVKVGTVTVEGGHYRSPVYIEAR